MDCRRDDDDEACPQLPRGRSIVSRGWGTRHAGLFCESTNRRCVADFGSLPWNVVRGSMVD